MRKDNLNHRTHVLIVACAGFFQFSDSINEASYIWVSITPGEKQVYNSPCQF